MENTYKFPDGQLWGQLFVNGQSHALVDLPALFGERLKRLPVVLRLLLENAVRNMQGDERQAAVDAVFAGWSTAPARPNWPFSPAVS